MTYAQMLLTFIALWAIYFGLFLAGVRLLIWMGVLPKEWIGR